MLRIFRHSILFRLIACYVILAMLGQLFFPSLSYALTSGPTQPEFTSFEPAGTSEMVDLATGDFTYNLDLLAVNGLGINVSYNSGMTVESEASVVGAGFNLNTGKITRQMRGLPDEFKGDLVKKRFYMKPNRTMGLRFGVGNGIIWVGCG